MIKIKYFIKFINKTYLTINKLIKNNLNKLNINYFSKITKSNKFILSTLVLTILFLSYLSIPNIHNKNEISKELNYQLQKKFNLNFNLSKNIKYKFFPRPHFIFKNSSILKNQSIVSQIEELKIFISLSNLFSLKNFEVQNLIIKKSNFNLNNQTYNFFIELLDGNFQNSEITIKNSNVFFKNKNNEVLFINKILNMKYFHDNKNLQNKIISNNEIFNLPYSIELKKDDIKKKIFFKLNLDYLKFNINNELDLNSEVKKGLVNFISNKNKFKATYSMDKNIFIFNLFDNLENSNFLYEGEINFNPFYSKLTATIKKINLFYLFDSNGLIHQFLKSEILNNKNLNLNLNFYAGKSSNFRDFKNIFFNSKIQEGFIDIDNTKFSWKDSVDFLLQDSLIYVKDGELILDAKLDLTIKNTDTIYKFLLTPKNLRTELKKIKANFVYNFDQKIINLDNIIIDDNSDKKVNEILKNFIFKRNKLQNRVYLKSVINKALAFYPG